MPLAALGPILIGAAGTSAGATTAAWGGIAAGAAAGANIYGAHQQSSATQDASQLQQSYNDRALAAATKQNEIDNQLAQKRYELDQADEQARVAQGQTRLQNDAAYQQAQIGNLQFDQQFKQGGRDYSRAQYSQYLDRLQPFTSASQGAMGRLNNLLTPTAIPTNGKTVLLRAPDGSQQAVPAELVDHYVAKGAVPV